MYTYKHVTNMDGVIGYETAWLYHVMVTCYMPCAKPYLSRFIITFCQWVTNIVSFL
jgi:hypothetical protein